MQLRQFLQRKAGQVRAVIRQRRRCLGILLLLNGGLWGMPALYMAVFTPPSPTIELPNLDTLKQAKYDIYVVNWGFHTALILEQPQGWRLGPTNHAQARYVEYGWGDKRFFMLSDTSIPTTLAAGVLPTASVMYLRGRETLPQPQYARQLYHRQITPQQLHSLLRSLEQSFQRTTNGERVAPYPQVPRFAGQFYPGREYYVIWSDCNAWTVRQLQAINVAQAYFPVILSEQVGPSLTGFELIKGAK
ncbi:DUF2459 domain-containing protein [Acaryochloris sp. IP29b_bin.148]|uniref:DUF2459 domain-containing protein n=1 Tax=Acaryochloris sp. IP29b_bin.148 TaxID=2969218 RepID=UPI0026280139|nr:DUF2459 domain-containing protein [Acaryochloris sp. IP29b_bin.148]